VRWRSSAAGGYEVIPREAAVKIQERDPQRILLLNTHVEEGTRTIRTPPTRSLTI
jgi:uncharacterized protein YaiL (DUF2058 family)